MTSLKAGTAGTLPQRSEVLPWYVHTTCLLAARSIMSQILSQAKTLQ
jgi:hypothetical protein